MSCRDDLQAAIARAEALDRENKRLRGETENAQETAIKRVTLRRFHRILSVASTVFLYAAMVVLIFGGAGYAVYYIEHHPDRVDYCLIKPHCVDTDLCSDKKDVLAHHTGPVDDILLAKDVPRADAVTFAATYHCPEIKEIER